MKLLLGGVFDLECLERGKVLWCDRFKNGIADQGLNYGLAAALTGGAAIATWYLGLIDNLGFTTGLANADTMASHAGWIEAQTYVEANRPTWNSTLSGNVLTNAAALTIFTMNAAKTIRGLFLCSNNVKGGTTGTLWCTGLDGAGRVVTPGQVLRVRYTCTAAGA